MDLDSIITFVFILAFFVLPTVLKMLAARKKKAGGVVTPKKNPSVLGRIGEQIQKFVQELEEQAQQQGREGKDQEVQSVWETLAEETEPEYEDLSLPPESSPDYIQPFSTEEIGGELEKMEVPKKRCTSIKQDMALENRRCVKSSFRDNPLQNAIIWSEILSKPVALREK